jgi:hypothetical protein
MQNQVQGPKPAGIVELCLGLVENGCIISGIVERGFQSLEVRMMHSNDSVVLEAEPNIPMEPHKSRIYV